MQRASPDSSRTLPIKSRAVAFTENYRQKIERWNIGWLIFWNVPGHREMSQFSGKLPGELHVVQVGAARVGYRVGPEDFAG
jgi:hypothetical protein